MKLAYHGSISGEPSGFLTHFGSFAAAAQRVETLFCANEIRALNSQRGVFHVFDSIGQKFLREETPAEALNAFVAFAKNSKVFKVALDTIKPLYLEDCWDDDPIGSAGIKAIAGRNKLSREQRQQLADIFQPFDGIIYPDDIFRKLTQQDFEGMKSAICQDSVFGGELEKRKAKLGTERFTLDEPFEIVWTYYTKKLFEWAKANNFDSFAYQSQHEGAHEHSFHVTFDPKQVQVVESRIFCPETYLSAVSPIFKERLSTVRSDEQGFAIGQDIFLDAENLDRFWRPTGSGLVAISEPSPF